MTEHPPRRVRVTADPLDAPGAARGAATRGIALPGAPVDDADAVYARALRRSQLRLALGTVAGFVVVTAVLALVIALIPEIDRAVLFGLPLSWVLQAFSFYPVIVAFSLLYVHGAARNERAYRALRERG